MNVTHEMKVMSEETFGPVFGIMKVRPTFSHCEFFSLPTRRLRRVEMLSKVFFFFS